MAKFFFLSLIAVLSFLNTSPIKINDNININGNLCLNTYCIEYGSISFNGEQNAIINIISIETGKVLKKIIYDSGLSDTIIYIAKVGNDSFITVCDEENNFNHFKQIELLRYNLYNNDTIKITLDKIPIYYNNLNNHLILTMRSGDVSYIDSELKNIDSLNIEIEYQGIYELKKNNYQGDAYVDGKLVNFVYIDKPGKYKISIGSNNQLFEYWITVSPQITIEGERFNDGYLSPVNIKYNGVIYLNDEAYEYGIEVVTPGNYHVLINGNNNYIYEENFIIVPNITYFDGLSSHNFIDNLEVNSSLSIYSNAISMLIDDKIYKSSLIDDVGEHTLSLYGVNDMVINLSFKIYPNVIGLVDNENYKKLEIKIFGNALLNGEIVSGIVQITEPGNYSLDLLYLDEVYASYNFTIVSEDKETTTLFDSKLYFSYAFLIIVIIGGYIILRKK